MSRSRRKQSNASFAVAAIVGMGLPAALFRSILGAEFAIVVVSTIIGIDWYKAHRRAVRVACLRNKRALVKMSCSVSSAPSTGNVQTAEQLGYWNAIFKRARA